MKDIKQFLEYLTIGMLVVIFGIGLVTISPFFYATFFYALDESAKFSSCFYWPEGQVCKWITSERTGEK